MAAKLLADEKLRLIKRAQAREKVSGLCREFGVSRAFFYKVLSRYLKSGQDPASLESSSQKQSPKSVSPEKEQLILDIVRTHPQYSSRKIASVLPKDELGRPVVGNHGIQNVLVRHSLSTYQKRLAFAGGRRKVAPEKLKLPPEARLAMIRRVEAGERVAAICREYGISRTLFYRLLKRYQAEREDKLAALTDRPPRPIQFWRLTPGDIEKKVLEIVSEYPQLSAHKIVAALPQVAGRPIVANKGVQNILRRHQLSTYEQRLAYSRLTEAAWKPRFSMADIPYIPLKIWRMLYAPFATIPKLGWLFTRGQLLLLGFLLSGFYFFKIIGYIITSPAGTIVGTFFASIALTFGLFFFLYSLKYYISVLLVLRLAQSGAGQTTDNSQLTIDKNQQGQMSNVKGQLLKILSKLGLRLPQRQGVNPLLINLEKVKLEGERPFVSIHVAVYNEKKVVERLIRACTGQEWFVAGPVGSSSHSTSSATPDPDVSDEDNGGLRALSGTPSAAATRNPELHRRANYEVVIVDDSNDETTKIAKQTLVNNGWSVQGSNKPDFEAFVFTKPDGPKVTLIHRFSRSGFKGGALQKALENTDERADYICVFDADFVPYPDTVEQFVKTFQVLGASGQVGSEASGQEPTDLQANQPTSPIAAVQGYQWHVLNKSQTWVTRGVRTEYAGSYVIERSSEEIYGGLKQIAGSVYAIRANVLKKFGWGTSITEDFELTLRLYEAGYKVAFTPYIQVPSEVVSTIKKLVRQRMRWAEGASFNVRNMFRRLMASPYLTGAEKAEFVYLSPYYLQAFFFVVGTFSWFMAEAVLGSRLPFWTSALGWSLVFTNLLALPLMNIVGMFLEETDERDYVGILSFIALSYIVVPFQAYAAVKGFLEKEEGPWFRTPKTGLVTDVFGRSGFEKFFGNLLGKPTTLTPGVSQGAALHTPGVLPAFASAFNPLQGSNFAIRPRHLRHIGNLALGLIITMTVGMSLFAPFVPKSRLEVQAEDRKFATLSDAATADGPVSLRENYQAEDEEIAQPFVVRYPGPYGKALEYIFHPEPRVRTKFDGREIELKVVSSDGLGKVLVKDSIRVDGNYLYEEIFDGVDLKYSVENGGSSLVENFILKEYKNFETIDYELKTVDLEVAYRDGEIYFASRNGGNPLFTFTRPYLYEGKNPGNKNFGVELVLSKDVFGWKLQKRLTEEGRDWLRDPARSFPVVIDPTQITSTIQTAVSTAESDYGQQQRKIVWANGALNGNAWYAVYEDAGGIFYEKCVPSVDGCETGTDWTDRTDIGESGGTADTDNNNPSVWWESDRAKMWVVWADNSRDNLQFVDIDVDASDPGTAGTLCSGADQANHNPTTWQVTITLDSSDTIYVSYVDTSTSTVNNMYRIATGGCTFTAILTSSGVDASDRPILLATGTQTLHAIFQDGTTIRHSVYVNDATPGWDSADTDITGVAADNTTTNYSAATDGTDIWLIADQGTSGVDLWTCAACAASSSWTDAADPWSSQGTDITEVSLAYDSGTDDILALALRSDAPEKVITKSTDTTTISWTSEVNLGTFGDTALEDISSTMSVNTIDGAAFVVEDGTNSELEFSTVPEKTLYLLVTVPFWGYLLKKFRRRNDDQTAI